MTIQVRIAICLQTKTARLLMLCQLLKKARTTVKSPFCIITPCYLLKIARMKEKWFVNLNFFNVCPCVILLAINLHSWITVEVIIDRPYTTCQRFSVLRIYIDRHTKWAYKLHNFNKYVILSSEDSNNDMGMFLKLERYIFL
jgi:hypothetical protein